MNQSYIVDKQDGATTFVGYDATYLYRAIVLKVALGLYARRANRNWTPTQMMALAKEYTGKTYKRKPERAHFADAARDVVKWIETCKAAMEIKHA